MINELLYIYVGQDGEFFKPFEKYYLVSFADKSQILQVCIEDESGNTRWTTTEYFYDKFKKISQLREEKIKTILE
jgi:hypothetical protein